MYDFEPRHSAPPSGPAAGSFSGAAKALAEDGLAADGRSARGQSATVPPRRRPFCNKTPSAGGPVGKWGWARIPNEVSQRTVQ